MTNKKWIQTMSSEELAEYLFNRGNGCEYCYGVCAVQDECEGKYAKEYCISNIVRWLKEERK